MQVNRYLNDKAMDRIDHALGRPVDVLGTTYRNFYATGGDLADEMAVSPYWAEGRRGNDMRYFAVTDDGRMALAAHLRDIGDKHRSFSIKFDGHTSTVVATTRNKARYSHFLDIRDVMPDLAFVDYCRRASVRVVGAR